MIVTTFMRDTEEADRRGCPRRTCSMSVLVATIGVGRKYFFPFVANYYGILQKLSITQRFHQVNLNSSRLTVTKLKGSRAITEVTNRNLRNEVQSNFKRHIKVTLSASDLPLDLGTPIPPHIVLSLCLSWCMVHTNLSKLIIKTPNYQRTQPDSDAKSKKIIK